MSNIDVKSWIRGNDIFRKLEVAIEDIRVGQGDAVFNGLQNGKCTVDIVWDGAYVHFYPHAENKERKVDVTMLPDGTPVTNETLAQAVNEPETPTPEPEEPVPDEDQPTKRKRRTYVT